jgi:hypothetical protein
MNIIFMKPILPVIFLCIAFVSSLKGQEFSYTGKGSLPKIMTTLFNGQWNGSYCVWKPNYYEKSVWGESFDGMLYTEPDTVMIYRTTTATKLILVTTTRRKETATEFESFHTSSIGLSIVTFDYDKSKGTLFLIGFEKLAGVNGSWGEPDAVSLRPFGGDDYFLEINGGYAQMGVMAEYFALYYLGKEVLWYGTTANNSGNIPEGEEGYWGYTTEVTFENQAKIISLTKKGTEEILQSDGTSRIQSINETAKYQLVNVKLEKLCP